VPAALPPTAPWLELAGRAVCALGLSVFAWRVFREFLTHGGVVLLLLLVAETLTVVLVILARFARQVDHRAPAFALTVLATFYFLFLDVELDRTARLAPPVVSLALQFAGVTLQILGKLWLGPRFGLLPGNRGVVTGGPYRLIRHPIYFGYFLAHIGFLLNRFSPYNAALYFALYLVQFGRCLKEEELLLKDPEYRAYAARVRHRFIPWVV
jgi:protein-S-isoprenylcysteine O-methyltransferase Ste14